MSSFMDEALSRAGKHHLSDGTPSADNPPAPAAEEVVTPVPTVESAEVLALRAELAATKQARVSDKLKSILTDSALKHNVIDAALASQLLAGSVKMDEHGQVQVLTESGNPRLNSQFQCMTVDELMSEFCSSRPYMQKSDLRGGAGSTPAQRYNYAPQYKVTEIFGSGSSSMKASKLMRENPTLYRQMRKQAVEMDILD
jgi:hypothetical protein